MFENERDFRKTIAGMGIDTEPNPAHRERLRQQMLSTFEATEGGAGSKRHPQAALEAATRPRLFSWRGGGFGGY